MFKIKLAVVQVGRTVQLLVVIQQISTWTSRTCAKSQLRVTRLGHHGEEAAPRSIRDVHEQGSAWHVARLSPPYRIALEGPRREAWDLVTLLSSSKLPPVPPHAPITAGQQLSICLVLEAAARVVFTGVPHPWGRLWPAVPPRFLQGTKGKLVTFDCFCFSLKRLV